MKSASVIATFRPAVVIAVRDHFSDLVGLVDNLSRSDLSVFLVDDGSPAPCANTLDTLCASHARLIRLARKSGKGAAVRVGLFAARNAGFTHVLQIDDDAQYKEVAINSLLTTAKAHPQALVCGTQVDDESVPASRLFGRRLTNGWMRVHCQGKIVADALCGFRVYPVESVTKILKTVRCANHSGFDPEIAVRLVWAGVPVINVAVRATYLTGGISPLRAFSDNLRLFCTHVRLFLTRVKKGDTP